jgi:hypothetical protein
MTKINEVIEDVYPELLQEDILLIREVGEKLDISSVLYDKNYKIYCYMLLAATIEIVRKHQAGIPLKSSQLEDVQDILDHYGDVDV